MLLRQISKIPRIGSVIRALKFRDLKNFRDFERLDFSRSRRLAPLVILACFSIVKQLIPVAGLCFQVGYRLRTNNASTYRVYPSGVVRARKMDQLVFFCESCPRHKYSLGAGSFIYRSVTSFVLSSWMWSNTLNPSPRPMSSTRWNVRNIPYSRFEHEARNNGTIHCVSMV